MRTESGVVLSRDAFFHVVDARRYPPRTTSRRTQTWSSLAHDGRPLKSMKAEDSAWRGACNPQNAEVRHDAGRNESCSDGPFRLTARRSHGDVAGTQARQEGDPRTG